MSALQRFADPQPLQMGGAECVAFIGDSETQETVATVAQQF